MKFFLIVFCITLFWVCQDVDPSSTPEKEAGEMEVVLPKDWRANDLFDNVGLSEGDLTIESEPLMEGFSKRAVMYRFKGLPVVVSVGQQTNIRLRTFSLDLLVFEPLQPMEKEGWYEAKTRERSANLFVKKLEGKNLLELYFVGIEYHQRVRDLAIEFRNSLRFKKVNLDQVKWDGDVPNGRPGNKMEVVEQGAVNWKASDWFDIEGLAEDDLEIDPKSPAFLGLMKRSVRYFFKQLRVTASVDQHTDLASINSSLASIHMRSLEPMKKAGWYEAKSRDGDFCVFVRRLHEDNFLKLWIDYSAVDNVQGLKTALEFRDSLQFEKLKLEETKKKLGLVDHTDFWATDLFDVEGIPEGEFEIGMQSVGSPLLPPLSTGGRICKFKGLSVVVSVSGHSELPPIDDWKANSFHPLEPMEKAGWHRARSKRGLANVFVKKLEDDRYIELWFGSLSDDMRLALEFRDSIKFRKIKQAESEE
jgi:hypothetical protein